MFSGTHRITLTQFNSPEVKESNLPSHRQGSIQAPVLTPGRLNQGATLANITMKELLEAGVHFGHQTKRWNPKMKEYIFGERNGIYIIDLQKTLKMFKEASKFVTDLTSTGKLILFVGTKRQAQDAIAEEATRAGMPYINSRWLGGLLTNWVTVQKSVKRLSRTRRHVHRRPLRAPHQEGSHQARARAQAPVDQPRRHQEHEAPSRRHLRR